MGLGLASSGTLRGALGNLGGDVKVLLDLCSKLDTERGRNEDPGRVGKHPEEDEREPVVVASLAPAIRAAEHVL